MRDKGPEIHIVSFDVPYPANYGGVIDVFHKIRVLHGAGVNIHLHCFLHKRKAAPELEKYCKSVHYYHRKTGWSSNFSLKPYIVKSRLSGELLANLLRDNHPVLFEGLHTCGLLTDSRLKGRMLIYRESNVEHHYYYHLFRAEKATGKKVYYLTESIRLKFFQRILQHATVMLAVSLEDAAYLSGKFGKERVRYLPSFHGHDEPDIIPGKGGYALYHGKLSVPENIVAAEFLIEEVWNETLPELVIAGLDPPEHLKRRIAGKSNIRIVENPDESGMYSLLRNAQVNILITFQPTGLKLKLLNALYNGRFCLVNPEMVAGTSLGGLCRLATTPEGFRSEINNLFSREFSDEMIAERKSVLGENYSDRKNCKQLLEILTLPL